jgi:hypothetical protein
MVRRVPVLRQHNMVEPRCQLVDEGHDFVTARNGEPAARTEIVLHIDHQQQIARADGKLVGHYAGRCWADRRMSTSSTSRLRRSPICTG